jgi:pectinesterase
MHTKFTLKSFGLILLSCLMGMVQAQTLSSEVTAIADIVVDIQGGGDYVSIQAAFDALPDSSDEWTVVFVKKGIYAEKVILNHMKTKVILVGEDVDSTIITNDNYGDQMLPGGHTFSTYTFRADPHDFQAYNITFENPSRQGQAVAFHSNGDRQILHHCKMLGYQDTYFDNFRTRRYINDCYIEGAVDYIFGFGVTLFDSCQIHTIDDGYITAASTPQYYEFGYVFKDCWLTSKSTGSPDIYLGRPWFPYSNTIFFECWQTEDIFSVGWARWDGREQTCLYAEYNCSGPGFRPDRRVAFSEQLDPALAPRYQIDTIFAASNFPSDLGPEVDSIELWSMRDRFDASGYAQRADTILYAGRDFWPEYPTDDWSPVFYAPVHQVIKAYTQPFGASVDTSSAVSIRRPVRSPSVSVLSPVQDWLIVSTSTPLPTGAKLVLYDLNGRQLLSQPLDNLSPGMHKVSIQSLGLTPGYYVYQLQAASGLVASGKLLKS